MILNPHERRPNQLSSEDAGDAPESAASPKEKQGLAMLPEAQREALLALGHKTGREEDAVNAHYERTSAIVRYAAEQAGGSASEEQRQQIAAALMKRISPYYRGPEQTATFEQALSAAQQLEAQDTDAFVQETSVTLVSTLYRTMTQAEQEARSREIMAEKFTSINELLWYGKTEDKIHIHLAEARLRGQKELTTLLAAGMRDLAPIIAADEDVRRVTATSWIVAHRSGQKQMERLGFTIDGPINKATRQQNFPDDRREIWTSHIDRDDFLRLYQGDR